MKYHWLHDLAPDWLRQPLADFESQFRYPLGSGMSFSISHGPNYPRFYRAMGPAAVLVAEHNGEIQGIISVALKSVRWPTGADEHVAYFGDFKVSPVARHGIVPAQLLRQATRWAQRQAVRAFAVVMDGTEILPTSYTGRLDLPQFTKLDLQVLLRIAVEGYSLPSETQGVCDVSQVASAFRTLATDAFVVELGETRLRSRCPATGLITPNAAACGIVEDTRRAKRLYRNDGVELVSAHLSCFAYKTLDDGVRLIHEALAICRRHQIPAMFVATGREHADLFATQLGEANVTRAPATIFGCDFPASHRWYLHTSEI